MSHSENQYSIHHKKARKNHEGKIICVRPGFHLCPSKAVVSAGWTGRRVAAPPRGCHCYRRPQVHQVAVHALVVCDGLIDCSIPGLI